MLTPLDPGRGPRPRPGRAGPRAQGHLGRGPQGRRGRPRGPGGRRGADGDRGRHRRGGGAQKLLDGGHHHNAAGEAQGLFDEGFVIVTRAAKAKLLGASRNIGQMARAPKADALEAEWTKVEATLSGLLSRGK